MRTITVLNLKKFWNKVKTFNHFFCQKYEAKNMRKWKLFAHIATSCNRVDGSAPKERSAPLTPPYVRVSYTAVRKEMS